MSYENPEQPEGINVTAEHPLREFFSLLLMLLLIVAVALTVLSLAAQSLARFVPFAVEARIAELLDGPLATVMTDETVAGDAESLAREAYIRELAVRLSGHMDLPAEMTVTARYSNAETVNAFATLGGQVVLFKGLVDQLPNENALAMVLAHEIAHVQLRHPIVAMSRGLTVSLALASVFGLTDNAGVMQLVQWLGVTSALSFSRSQERAADALAADAVLAEYGHLEGATDLFRALNGGAEEASASPGLPFPEFRATHPALSERIDVLAQRAAALGVSGQPTPLPW